MTLEERRGRCLAELLACVGEIARTYKGTPVGQLAAVAIKSVARIAEDVDTTTSDEVRRLLERVSQARDVGEFRAAYTVNPK